VESSTEEIGAFGAVAPVMVIAANGELESEGRKLRWCPRNIEWRILNGVIRRIGHVEKFCRGVHGNVAHAVRYDQGRPAYGVRFPALTLKT